MTIFTNTVCLELQAVYHNEERHISKNQAHFETLTAGQKKLIHLGEERISIDNLRVCLLVLPDSLEATNN